MTPFSAVKLPARFCDAWWCISPLTGALIRYETIGFQAPSKPLPTAVSNALHYCNHPFECQWNAIESRDAATLYIRTRLERLNARLLALGNTRFLLSLLYAAVVVPLFDTTKQAFGAISTLPEQASRKEELCLPRSLLAAKVSRSFADGGVLFIGAMLESRDMHAWIIERGEQPDPDDRIWINYRPLLAFTRS